MSHGLPDPAPCSTAAVYHMTPVAPPPGVGELGQLRISGLDTVDTRLVTQQQSRYVASHCRVIKLYRVAGA